MGRHSNLLVYQVNEPVPQQVVPGCPGPGLLQHLRPDLGILRVRPGHLLHDQHGAVHDLRQLLALQDLLRNVRPRDRKKLWCWFVGYMYMFFIYCFIYLFVYWLIHIYTPTPADARRSASGQRGIQDFRPHLLFRKPPNASCVNAFLCGEKHPFLLGFRSYVRQFLAAFWCLPRPSLPWCFPVRQVLFWVLSCVGEKHPFLFLLGFRSYVRQFLAAFWCLLRPSLPWCFPVRQVLFWVLSCAAEIMIF